MTKLSACLMFAFVALGLIMTQPSFAQTASGSAPAASSPAAAPAPAAPAAPSGASAQPPAAAASPAQAEAPPAPHGHGIGAATILTIHGKIASVNSARRTVTLVGPEGHKATFKVAKSVDMASMKAGDPFVVRFFESIHIRRKRPGEQLAAVSLKEGITAAAPGENPGGVYHSKRKFVIGVSAIDSQDQTVTVKDPDGKEETVKVGNPAYLRRIKVGEDLVVTVRQAVAISFDKE